MHIDLKKLAGSVLLGLCCASAAQATTYIENFNDAFPKWQTNWFGLNSNAQNVYCADYHNCAMRGNNPDGLWISTADGKANTPVAIQFDPTFGASLTSFQLDVAGAQPTTLIGYDMAGAVIFSQAVFLTSGFFTNPGVYATYKIESTNGISGFTFTGKAQGNTSIDNLIAEAGAAATDVPEPLSTALIGAGLLGLGLSRRHKAKANGA